MVKKGLIDLRKWNIESKNEIKLSGEWEFIGNKLIDPNNIGDQKTSFIQVPGVGILPPVKDMALTN